MTFAFIDDHQGQWPVRLMCDTLDVSTAGYYACGGGHSHREGLPPRDLRHCTSPLESNE